MSCNMSLISFKMPMEPDHRLPSHNLTKSCLQINASLCKERIAVHVNSVPLHPGVQPQILFLGDNIFSSNLFYISIDNFVLPPISTLVSAIELLFMLIWILDLKYPTKLTQFYLFIEALVRKDTSEKPVELGVKASVLLNKLVKSKNPVQ